MALPKFNKMFVMIPVMLAARKIDGEDPTILFLMRCAYGTVQTLITLSVLFIYFKSSAVAGGEGSDRTIYVPPAPQPFDDPNAKKKYTEAKFGSHVSSQARSLVASTLFGTCMTVGLHVYKGMVIGIAIQTIMGPFTLFENALAKALFMGGGIDKADAESRIFGEKTREELTEEDEVVDGSGNPIEFKKAIEKKSEKKEKKTQPFEELLLDTWDAGAEADIVPLMAALNKKNVNFATAASRWTPVMVMSAIGVKQTPSALGQMKALGGNPSVTDEEGWNSLHWAAFHGSAEGAKQLLSETVFDGLKLGLHLVTDKDGKTPLDHAKAEGNDMVAKVIEEAISTAENKEQSEGGNEGLRKRK